MSLLTKIPKVDKILQTEQLRELLLAIPRPVVVAAVRQVLKELRQQVLHGECSTADLSVPAVVSRITAACAAGTARSLKRVVNGTGVVIHTNLGRSLLPEAAREALLEAAFHPTNLELDVATGRRGKRYDHVERLLCELTGAEAALVVNNNAAAVLLALSAVAQGREVVVSRGELVEIGGAFRIPDVMTQSGATLREVGTTNRTHPRDYRSAVTEETALFLKVHTSNYSIVGFTAEVDVPSLVALGKEAAVPVMVDLGSGSLVDLSRFMACAEPSVQEIVRAGVDLVTFSGDKLLGGPQAGIIVGSRKMIEVMERHPLLRALRIDKLTLAALEATLRLYRDQRQVLDQIPTLRQLHVPKSELLRRGRLLLRRLRVKLPSTVVLGLEEGVSQVGGGALPLLDLPTVLLSIEPTGMSAADVDQCLREGQVPILGRINKGKFLLDLRTLRDDDEPCLVAGLAGLAPTLAH